MKITLMTLGLGLALTSTALAQEEEPTPSKLDIRAGSGVAFMGSGDMLALQFENELNYRLNPYFTVAASAGFGKSDVIGDQTASFLQGNTNVFVSPFRNDGYMDLRVGGGLSLYNVSHARVQAISYENGEIVDVDHRLDQRSSLGFNIILEYSLAVGEKYLIGAKAFTQPYLSGDINSGLVFKAGIRL
ncbi:MAG TPA: hypothetical protein DCE41_02600 [Cytophagales bacterium]|nr:hypothetical protein [Cytophagales bacterium]HAA17913.1 hypothetical protein [Cytophagales bacterium]HAP65281.1 hypothetical protein [Cytophagales bacterium]